MTNYEDAVHMMQEFGGSFVSLIAKAWYAADEINRKKLEACFSEYFKSYERMYMRHSKRARP